MAYADGTQSTVYARINVPWGFGEGWGVDVGPWSSSFMGPDPDFPNDTYVINLWLDFYSEESTEPYSVGEIVPIGVDAFSEEPVPDIVTIFSRP